MKFRADNRIRYRQDLQRHRGIPSGVDFRVTVDCGLDRWLRRWRLIACGYGCRRHEGCFGDGSLTVSLVNTRLQRRFVAAELKEPTCWSCRWHWVWTNKVLSECGNEKVNHVAPAPEVGCVHCDLTN